MMKRKELEKEGSDMCCSWSKFDFAFSINFAISISLMFFLVYREVVSFLQTDSPIYMQYRSFSSDNGTISS